MPWYDTVFTFSYPILARNRFLMFFFFFNVDNLHFELCNLLGSAGSAGYPQICCPSTFKQKMDVGPPGPLRSLFSYSFLKPLEIMHLCLLCY